MSTAAHIAECINPPTKACSSFVKGCLVPSLSHLVQEKDAAEPSSDNENVDIEVVGVWVLHAATSSILSELAMENALLGAVLLDLVDSGHFFAKAADRQYFLQRRHCGLLRHARRTFLYRTSPLNAAQSAQGILRVEVRKIRGADRNRPGQDQRDVG